MRVHDDLAETDAIPEPPNPIDCEEAARLYTEEALSYAEIARRLGRHPHGIRQALLRSGVRKRESRAPFEGAERERLRGIYKRLKAACKNPRAESYAHYGGKGILWSPQWRKFEPFCEWAADSGYDPRRKQSLALDHGANEFSPSTCHWIDRDEMLERRQKLLPLRTQRVVTAFGETKGAAAWARDPRCKVTLDSLCMRLDKGYDSGEAIAAHPGSLRRSSARRGATNRTKSTRKKRQRGDAEHWKRVIRLHTREGLSCAEIGRIVGRTSGAIRAGLIRRDKYRPTKPKLEGLKFGKPLLEAWKRMHRRCTIEKHIDFQYYGAKGIRVCAAWASFERFHAWAIETGYRQGLCLTRRDRRRHFTPGNCLWVERELAAKRAHHPPRPGRPRWRVSAFGETKGPTAWSRDPRCAVSNTALIYRLRAGWPAEQALTLPPQRDGERKHKVLIAALGEAKTRAEWARDDRCRITQETLDARLKRGIPAETAITTPPYKLHVGKPLS